MTGRLLASDLPRRQPRRVSNFVLPAVAISNPKACSNGPAVILTDVIPPQGHPFETPAAACLVAASSPAGAPGGHVVERVGSDVTAIFVLLHTKRELGGYLLRDGAQGDPVIGLLHVPEHGEADEQDVAENLRGLANVCS